MGGVTKRRQEDEKELQAKKYSSHYNDEYVKGAHMKPTHGQVFFQLFSILFDPQTPVRT